MLPAHKQATALLRGYLETRVKHVHMGSEPTKGELDLSMESRAAKSMLCMLDRVQADGNAAEVELALVKGDEYGTVLIYFNIKGIGRVKWLPAIVTAANGRLAHIIRETGVNRVMIDPVTREANEYDRMETSQRNFPPRVKTRLIPGKAI